MAEPSDILTQIRSQIDEFYHNGATPPGDDSDDGGQIVRSWKLESLSDAYQDVEPTKFLVDGLLPVPSLSIVYGGPGSLKSMLLCDMAMCVAGGSYWLEALPTGNTGITFHTLQAPVLWVDFDNGTRRTRERIGAIGRGHALPADVPFRYVSMPTPWLDASDTAIVRDLAELIRRNKIQLLVIDNLGLITGSVEENSGEMAQVMGHLRWLSEDASCAVIVVHHQRKSSGGGGDKNVRKGETLRGHSTIEASLDLALLIERNGREDAVAVVATKVRDYQEFDVIGAQWTYEHRAGTKQLLCGRFWSKSVETGEEVVNIAIKAHIKNELRRGGALNQRDLVNAVRDVMAAKPGGKPAGINKVRGLLKELVEDGAVVEVGTQQDRKYANF